MAAATTNNTLGALELGLIISSMLYGVECIQVFHYFNHTTNDRPGLKRMVFALWILETVHMALAIAWFYGISVTKFGIERSYADLTWTYCVSIMFHALVGTLVQWFFSWRVWTVSGKRLYLALPPALMSVFRCALAFFIAVEFGSIGEKDFHTRYTWSFILAQALNTITDVWNAIALVLFLHTRRSAYKRTNDLLNRIILFTLETGMVTAGLALTLCLTWAFMPTNEVWAGVLFIYTRAIANAVLVALNSRRSEVQPGHGTAVTLSTLSHSRTNEVIRSPTDTREGVLVQTETIYDKEYPLA